VPSTDEMPFVKKPAPRRIEISTDPMHGGKNAIIIERGRPVWGPEHEVVRIRVRRSGNSAPELSDRDWVRAFLAATRAGILRPDFLEIEEKHE